MSVCNLSYPYFLEGKAYLKSLSADPALHHSQDLMRIAMITRRFMHWQQNAQFLKLNDLFAKACKIEGCHDERVQLATLHMQEKNPSLFARCLSSILNWEGGFDYFAVHTFVEAVETCAISADCSLSCLEEE